MTYELHPLCTLFPRMDGVAFESLREDIRANGLAQPLTIHEGMILDGGNRYRACVEIGIEPTTVTFTGDNAHGFVLTSNLHRRHLTPGQNGTLTALAQEWNKAHTHGGDRRSDHSATLHLGTVVERAAMAGCSVRTQKMADKVARADPELARSVGWGKLTLPEALKQIAAKNTTVPTTRKGRKKAAVAQELAKLDAVIELDRSEIYSHGRRFLRALKSQTEFAAHEKEIIEQITAALEAM